MHWWHPALYFLPPRSRHGCCQPQTMSGRNWFLEEGQLAAAQPGQGRNDANQQEKMLWGPGEICNCSIHWEHVPGQHHNRWSMQALDSTFSHIHQRKLTHFLPGTFFVLKAHTTFSLSFKKLYQKPRWLRMFLLALFLMILYLLRNFRLISPILIRGK